MLIKTGYYLFKKSRGRATKFKFRCPRNEKKFKVYDEERCNNFLDVFIISWSQRFLPSKVPIRLRMKLDIEQKENIMGPKKKYRTIVVYDVYEHLKAVEVVEAVREQNTEIPMDKFQ